MFSEMDKDGSGAIDFIDFKCPELPRGLSRPLISCSCTATSFSVSFSARLSHASIACILSIFLSFARSLFPSHSLSLTIIGLPPQPLRDLALIHLSALLAHLLPSSNTQARYSSSVFSVGRRLAILWVLLVQVSFALPARSVAELHKSTDKHSFI
jgi:hypothetical protein